MRASGSDEPWLELYDYWRGKHSAGRPPRPGDLDPLIEIPRLVGRLMLIELVADDFRYRLVGSTITACVKADMTRSLVGATGLSSSAVSSAWRDLLVRVRDTGRPILTISTLPGDNVVANHCLLLPLVAADGRVERIMVGAFLGGHEGLGRPVDGLDIQHAKPALLSL